MEQWTSQSVIAVGIDDGNRCPIECPVSDTELAKTNFGSAGLSLRITISIFVAVWVLSSSSSSAWQRLAAISNPVLNRSPLANQVAATPIVELIDRLDSPAFSQRQSATESIIEIGDRALPDLGQRFFESSPETNYRIRKALEGIAASGNEETFLKSSAILLTLYANGNDQIFEQIEQLRVKWQIQRTELAIERLKRTGAEVTQQNGYDIGVAQRGIAVTKLTAPRVFNPEKAKFVKRTVSEQKRMVDKILTNDVDFNRDFIFALLPSQARSTTTLPPNEVNLSLPLLAGTRIRFPEDWAKKNTEASPLEELQHINDRLFVEVSNSNFSDPQWQRLVASDNIMVLDLAAEDKTTPGPATLPASVQALTLRGFRIRDEFVQTIRDTAQLRQFQFTDCSFDKHIADKIDGIKRVQNIVCQFENQKLDAEMILAMAELGDLRTLQLTAVEFSSSALKSLRRLANVNVLYLRDMPATSQFFQNVGGMPRLNSVHFKGCKLDIPAYKRLTASQRVRMSFEAQAFLGIQGSSPIRGPDAIPDTVVSMVLPNSAAEAGGIKAGDLISKIDGEKVEDFNDVRLHITQYAAGDEVNIEVIRDGKREALKVKLRDYDTARKF